MICICSDGDADDVGLAMLKRRNLKACAMPNNYLLIITITVRLSLYLLCVVSVGIAIESAIYIWENYPIQIQIFSQGMHFQDNQQRITKLSLFKNGTGLWPYLLNTSYFLSLTT